MVLGLLMSLVLAVSDGSSECTIVSFTASWCQPCQQLQPALDQLRRAGHDVRAVDTDRESQLLIQYKIQNLPTVVLLSGGVEVDRLVGAVDYATLVGRVQRVAARGRSSSPNPLSPSSQWQQNSAELPATPATRQPTVRGQTPGIAPFPMLASAASALATQSSAGTVASSRQAPAAVVEGNPGRVPGLEEAIARAAAATVRIRVDEANTTAFGTGTIIDVHDREALVLTCGHLFRNMTPGSQLTVDLFQPDGQQMNLPAQLIDFQAEDEDIGLISFTTPVAIEPVEVLPLGSKPTIGMHAFSFGCDHGADPTRRDTQIKNINRYIGAENIEIYGAPAVGRSGGGLFDDQGRLLGVCNAADATDDEGIYAAASVVYKQIDRLGLSHLFENRSPTSNSNSLVSHAVEQRATNSQLDDSRQEHVGWPSEADAARALQLANSPGDADSQTMATHRQLICIVHDGDGTQRVVTIDAPSSQLIQAIEQQARLR
ncbi:MAG: trypsin-like peptidase domain-containing protein [Planctomycetales bacterium]|nr:trypsin-like peptidase domain-containing protein [Planctomycetales bacterium]